MRMTQYENFLKHEIGPELRQDQDTKDVKSLAYRISEPMTQQEWKDVRYEAVKDLDGYDIGLIGKGLTTFEACLYAFETAYRRGYTFDRFDLWSVFGKMEKSIWKKRREYRGLDEKPMHYFHLLLET